MTWLLVSAAIRKWASVDTDTNWYWRVSADNRYQYRSSPKMSDSRITSILCIRTQYYPFQCCLVWQIKSYAMSLINQINQKGRQLIGELQAVCNAKRRQLSQKNTEVRLLSDNLQHGLQFAEYLLTLSDDAALLYSRRTLMHQLSAILRTRCEVPNPYHVVDLRFCSSQLLTGSAWSLGHLMVDGFPYGNRVPAVPSVSSTNGRVTSSSPHGHFSATRAEPSQVLSSEQKLQKLQTMMQMRKMEHLRLMSRPATVAGPQVRAATDFSGGSSYTSTSMMVGSSLYPSHMPNQSSNISSSNQPRQDASGSYPSPSGYMPTAHSKKYVSQQSISLSPFQEQQHHQMPNHEQVTTTLQPIVIQPTNLPDQSEFIDFSFCRLPLSLRYQVITRSAACKCNDVCYDLGDMKANFVYISPEWDIMFQRSDFYSVLFWFLRYNNLK